MIRSNSRRLPLLHQHSNGAPLRCLIQSCACELSKLVPCAQLFSSLLAFPALIAVTLISWSCPLLVRIKGSIRLSICRRRVMAVPSTVIASEEAGEQDTSLVSPPPSCGIDDAWIG